MSTKKERMYQRIAEHGRRLLVLFPDALEHDPVRLCKRLRRFQTQIDSVTVDLCNGAISRDEGNELLDDYHERVAGYLASERVWVNRDPRGYALKIDLADGEHLSRDMGGYGIIAPDLSDD